MNRCSYITLSNIEVFPLIFLALFICRKPLQCQDLGPIDACPDHLLWQLMSGNVFVLYSRGPYLFGVMSIIYIYNSIHYVGGNVSLCRL